jgi:hypothetical protein
MHLVCVGSGIVPEGQVTQVPPCRICVGGHITGGGGGGGGVGMHFPVVGSKIVPGGHFPGGGGVAHP